MKNTILFFLVMSLLLSSVAHAAKKEEPKQGAEVVETSKYFTSQKIYVPDNYALYDYLEFSVFDMSKLSLVINGQNVDLQPKPVTLEPEPAKTTSKKSTPKKTANQSRYVDLDKIKNQTEAPAPVIPAQPASPLESTVRAELPNLPKYFYKTLKASLAKQKVPVTLYASGAPSYASRIKLYVKLVDIQISPATADKKEVVSQNTTVKIYGQIKAANGDAILTRFYDSVSTPIAANDKSALQITLQNMPQVFMDHLSEFLKTRY